MTREMINQRLEEAVKNGTLIMAHRGVRGGNITDNTLESYEVALRQGADILEVDVFRSLDGKLFVFHDGTEPYMLLSNDKVLQMTSEQIEQLRLVNKIGTRLDHKIQTLDEVLERFKGRCLINLDRCWDCWDDVFKCVLKHDMADQIIFKSAPKREYLELLEEQEIPFMYMPIIWYPEELDEIDTSKINMVAVEFIGHSEDAEIMQREFISGLKEKNIHCMISALTLGNPVYQPEKWIKRGIKNVVDGNIYLAAGHDDDVSILDSPDKGWGWLIDVGFDIIQTDWTRELSLYLNERKKNG